MLEGRNPINAYQIIQRQQYQSVFTSGPYSEECDLLKILTLEIIDKSNHYTCHVLGIVTLAQSASIALLSINQGKLTDDKHWLIECKSQTDASLLEAFLAHYYLADEYRTLWPNKIIFK